MQRYGVKQEAFFYIWHTFRVMKCWECKNERVVLQKNCCIVDSRSGNECLCDANFCKDADGKNFDVGGGT